MTRTSTHLLRIFITGLIAALPLAATVAIFWWLVSVLNIWLGPGSAIGQILGSFGPGVAESPWAAYLLGVALVGLAIFLLGLLVEAGLQRGLTTVVESVLGRIPVVRGVYDLAQKLVALVAQRDARGLKSMRPVWCHFGGAPQDGMPRVAVLGLQSTPEPVLIEGRPYYGVIVPTAPVPVGGGLLFLPTDWVRPADIGMEALTSIYVSMGMTAAQHVGHAGRTNPVQGPSKAT